MLGGWVVECAVMIAHLRCSTDNHLNWEMEGGLGDLESFRFFRSNDRLSRETCVTKHKISFGPFGTHPDSNSLGRHHLRL
jgi:hypothetical protein